MVLTGLQAPQGAGRDPVEEAWCVEAQHAFHSTTNGSFVPLHQARFSSDCRTWLSGVAFMFCVLERIAIVTVFFEAKPLCHLTHAIVSKVRLTQRLAFSFSGVQSTSVPALLVNHCDCVGYPNIAVPIIRTGIGPSRLPGTDYMRRANIIISLASPGRRVMTS